MSSAVPTLSDGEQFQLRRAKKQIQRDEWTKELDIFFQDSVIKNYFNFDLIAVELNQEAKRLGHTTGAAKASRDGNFTADKCRIRWSYLHLKVSPYRVITLLLEEIRRTDNLQQ